MKDIHKIHCASSAYPPLLTQLKGRPEQLYVRGNLTTLTQLPMVAIVGTRKITPYGRAVIKRMVPTWIRHGITTVSGLALGTDALVHEETLTAGGKTVAVLASGIDDPHISPRTNFCLAQRLLSENGALVSEYLPSTPADAFRFPERNRIIAGLSQVVVVTEGTMKSGTLITAKWALEYGRDVFAVPGPITTEINGAPNWLISQGAHPLLQPEDLLEYLGIDPQKLPQENTQQISLNAALIFSKLKTAPASADSLVISSKLDTKTVLAAISELEINELIFCSGNLYTTKV